jgi:phospholipid/cholesterol/gamma-HCH transport system ATP-binding protein
MTVMGGSGSGKSVMLKILIGLIRPDDGRVIFDGQDITDLAEAELFAVRRRASMVFQSSALFDSISVGENIAYPLREQGWTDDAEIERRVDETLELVGLPGIGRMRPADLSGGMRKRVGLARAIALRPEVILYDEPTTGLDPLNVRRISELILRMNEVLRVTSVVVTHDMASAFMVSDRMAMIAGGRIAAVGTADDFRRQRSGAVGEFVTSMGEPPVLRPSGAFS